MEADRTAEQLLKANQNEALGHNEPLTIETPAGTLRRRLLAIQDLQIAGPESIGSDQLKPIPKWPEKNQPRRAPDEPSILSEAVSETKPLKLSLLEALQIGAQNSRDYQAQKETVFITALDLDLQLREFRNTYTGLLESLVSSDHTIDGKPVTGVNTSSDFALSRKFESGAILTGRLSLDLAKLLSNPRASSMGVLADVSVTVPLLRGSGREIVTEPLTQAQRNLIYSFWGFERFKRTFAVGIATDYYAVLLLQDEVKNAADSYKRLIASTRRARALSEAGRLPQLQVDQAQQQELSAREIWIDVIAEHEVSLDQFKTKLGLPADARIELDTVEFDRLVEASLRALGTTTTEGPKRETVPADSPIVLQPPGNEGAGKYEMAESVAVRTALDHRLDLMTRRGRVYDSQRRVMVTADALQAGLTLVGSASTGESRSVGTATLPDASLNFGRGFYTGGLAIDLPWERTAERNLYRESYIQLEHAVRDVQDLEDKVKLDIRDELRQLQLARENFRIQSRAVDLARHRVDSTDLLLQAGRAQIRDLLEAQASLVGAQDKQAAAAVAYRTTELQIQRDMDVLVVNEKGIWREY